MKRKPTVKSGLLAIILLPLFVLFSANTNQDQPQLQPTLQVGDKAPLFAGKDHNGNLFISKEQAMSGPIVLVFYRGVWCGYCEKHLSELQDQFAEIKAKGAQVIVVTPETPENAAEMAKNTNAEFSIITDSDYKIMKDFGVAFKISEATVPAKWADLTLKNARKYNENEDDILPIPATFVIDKSHTIRYMHFDPRLPQTITYFGHFGGLVIQSKPTSP